MKKIILINLFAVMMTTVVVTSAHGQQRPSQRSFASVMAQVKQKQIARDKMMQQIKQTTPSSAASNSRNIQVQATQQPAINRQATQQIGNKKN